MYKNSRKVKLKAGLEFELLDILIPSIQETIEKDGDILCRGRSERLFASRLSFVLDSKIRSLLKENASLRVDSPYNKHGKEPKKLEGYVIEVDIAIHERGNDENNLLVIEIETSNIPKGDDIWKLKEITIQNEAGGYCYQFGLYLVLGILDKAGIILDERWFKDGVEIGGKFL